MPAQQLKRTGMVIDAVQALLPNRHPQQPEKRGSKRLKIKAKCYRNPVSQFISDRNVPFLRGIG